MSEVILPTDPIAAQPTQELVWISRTGKKFLEESIARYDGSTHRKCNRGHIIPKQSYCKECYALDQREKYEKFPKRVWKGEHIYSIAADKWFFSESREDLLEYMKEKQQNENDLMLVFVTPKYAYQISASDIYQEHLPDDIDLPDELQKAFDELNEKIKNCTSPLCYYPADEAVIFPW
ncbi:hypothetical protein WKH77_10525 [Acinetobacter baumannii]